MLPTCIISNQVANSLAQFSSIMHSKFNSKVRGAKSQMLVCRIVVGRVFGECGKAPSSRSSGSILKCHSEDIGNGIFSCRGPCLAYPEYIINYRDNSARVPNTQHFCGDAQQRPGRSESKMCVICMERPVRYLTIPCGYVLVICRIFSIVSICISHFSAFCARIVTHACVVKSAMARI